MLTPGPGFGFGRMSEQVRLLVVEDNPDDVFLLQRQLDQVSGYRFALVHVADPDEIHDVMGRHVPDLIFLDYRLGRMDGLDVLRSLRQQGWRTPVIILTGSGNEELAAEITRAGASDYVVKSNLKPQRLEAAIQRVLDESRQIRLEQQAHADTLRRLGQLTPREREVLEEIIAGLTNKQIAARFHRSIETIKVHRARIMEKMGASGTADLVRTILEARGVTPPAHLPADE